MRVVFVFFFHLSFDFASCTQFAIHSIAKCLMNKLNINGKYEIGWRRLSKKKSLTITRSPCSRMSVWINYSTELQKFISFDKNGFLAIFIERKIHRPKRISISFTRILFSESTINNNAVMRILALTSLALSFTGVTQLDTGHQNQRSFTTISFYVIDFWLLILHHPRPHHHRITLRCPYMLLCVHVHAWFRCDFTLTQPFIFIIILSTKPYNLLNDNYIEQTLSPHAIRLNWNILYVWMRNKKF